jgi:hypothetical protein
VITVLILKTFDCDIELCETTALVKGLETKIHSVSQKLHLVSSYSG